MNRQVFLWFETVVLTFGFASTASADDAGKLIDLQLQRQAPIKAGASQYHKLQTAESWAPAETAIVICDVWDRHHCLNAVRRVEEFGPRLNEVVKALRAKGVTVIHSPSDCMDSYADHPSRKRAIETPKSAKLPDDITSWCNRIPAEEAAVYPIDQSDGGEDDDPAEHAEWAAKLKAEGRNPGLPWKKQAELIVIDADRDYISDKGDEVWSVLESKGIKNVILAGVHTNMCVLGRPFGLRQMAKNGKHVVLLRDMTDTMYNPKMWPYVSHFEGTDRIISHIERHVCPTITSDQVLGGEPFRFQGDKRPHLVAIVSEYEYETDRTLTDFAAKYLGRDFRTTFVYGREEDGNDLVGIEAVKDADLLLVSVRRRSLPAEQLEIVRKYFASGKPAIGIRTASHAFKLREPDVPAGHAEWPEFDAEAWGGHYTGHYGDELKTTVEPVAAESGHPILHGIPSSAFPSTGTLYKAAPVAEGATVLATGSVQGNPVEPVAWVYTRKNGGKSFYTSLGHKGDFESPQFLRLFTNAVYWAAGKEPPREFAVVTAREDLRRRWVPISLGTDLKSAFGPVLDEKGGPIWFRCGVRIPSVFVPSRGGDPIFFVEGTSPCVWVNGEAAFQWGRKENPLPQFGPRTHSTVDPIDANLLVVRFANLGDVGEFADQFVLGWGASGLVPGPIELQGAWEMRVGDDESWSKPKLPAKFALSPEAYFEANSESR